MYIPEHEHPEVQLVAPFLPARKDSGAPREDIPRSFRIIPSGQPHVGHWPDGNEVIVVLISQSLIELGASELNQKTSLQLPPNSCAVDPIVHALASALRQEFILRNFGDSLFVEAIGTVLTGRLLRRWSTDSGEYTPGGRLSKGDLRMTLDVIERNMTSGLSIQMLAEQIGMGTHRFTREFKNATGRTPYQFIMELRIEKARALLEKTNLPLAEIALELGFASQSHFTAVFRQHVNTTPRTYRALFRSH